MNAKLILRMIGLVVVLEAFLMLVPFGVALGYGEPAAVFLQTAVGSAFCGGALFWLCRRAEKGLRAKEAFCLTALCWIALSFFGALPGFFLEGGAFTFAGFTDAFFMSVAGFTTTGANLFAEPESISHALLLWIGLTEWFGGIGILVLFVALLPALGEKSTEIMRAEVAGSNPGKFVPRIGDSAKILYAIYTVLTVVCLIALRVAGMPIFDAVVHTFSIAGTGGFSVRNAGLGAYPTATRMIASGFMLLFGVNFVFYFALLRRRFKEALACTEVFVYLAVAGLTTVLIWWQGNANLADTFFSVSSAVTTSGFSDTTPRSGFATCLLFGLMLMGGCAGSTAGGMKTARVLLLVQALRREIKRILRPRSVNVVKIGGRAVAEDVIGTTTQVFTAFIFVFFLGGAALAATGLPVGAAFTASLSCLSNVGMEFECSYRQCSVAGKWILSLLMLTGRLEIFPVLILLSPKAWSRG